MSLTVISATDDSGNYTTDQTSPTLKDIQSDTTPQTTKTINKNIQTNTKEAANTSVTSYTQLYETLTSPTADEDTTVTLDGEETYTVTDTITVNEAIKKLVINGNGKTIDGQNTKKFIIADTACDITINNLTIQNTYATTDGSAIQHNGGKLNIVNSQFNNNKVYNENSETHGGAVSTTNTELTIEKSVFSNNIANTSEFNDHFGGAISFNATTQNLKIKDSVFEENGINTHQTYGSAIFITTLANTTITNTTFKNNKGFDGNAIYYYAKEDSTLKITDSLFDSNNCLEEGSLWGYGGALLLYTNSSVIINNTEFTNNIAQQGGAIKFVGSSASNLEIDNSVFTGNNAYCHINYDPDYIRGDGGALHINTMSNVSIRNSNFTENYAERSGSAIEFYGTTSSNLLIDNLIFDKNGIDTSTNLATVSIVNYGNTSITNSSFTENIARNGAIDYQTGSVAFTDLITEIYDTAYKNHMGWEEFGTFLENLLTEMNTTLEEIIFGNPIKSDNYLFINNTVFKDNNATKGAAAVNIAYTANATIINSVFSSNMGAYGANLITSEGNVLIENNTYDSNKAVMSGLVEAGAGAINLITTGNTTINNINFTSNYGDDAGAVDYLGYNNSNLEITNSNFYNNGLLASGDGSKTGGAIAIATLGNVLLDNNNYTRNFATGGGAIYYINPSSDMLNENISENACLIINNSKFDSNGFSSMDYSADGGAIYLESGSNNIIDNSEFVNNRGLNGGAVALNGVDNKSNLTIINSKFDSNGVPTRNNDGEGGAIAIDTMGNVSINNSEFTRNHGESGAAIKFSSGNENASFIVDNVLFDSNGDEYSPGKHYTEVGSAIYILSGTNTNITNSKFLNNSAMEGVVYSDYGFENADFLIKNSVFKTNGYSIRDGVHSEEVMHIRGYNNVSIIDSYFNDNIVCSGLLVIYENNNLLIENSTIDANGLIHNAYEVEGRILYLGDMNNVLIINSSIVNNIAEEDMFEFYDITNLTIAKSYIVNNSILQEEFIEYTTSYNNKNYTCFNITDTVFDSNKIGSEGLFYLQTNTGDIFIDNTTFTDNIINPEGEIDDDIRGIIINHQPVNYYNSTLHQTIYANGSNIHINNTNFIGNGLPINRINLFGIVSGLIYHDANSNLTIDNSNFTANICGSEMGGVIDYKNGNVENRLLINHTSFKDNKIFNTGEDLVCQGIIVYTEGNTWIDNSVFSNNKIENSTLTDVTIEMKTGVIYNQCNVTNTIFADNYFANFIIQDNRIILDKITDYHESLMDDGYIPDFGDVVIYVDESDEGKHYKLVSETDAETGIRKTYVKDFKVDDENYVIKMVVNQTSESQYYEYETFHNNTYYLILPHDYKLTVEAISPIYVGDNTTITGKAYYTKSDGTIVAFTEKPVDLYINGTYIATTNTDSKGGYEFNYTGNIIGIQNVTIGFNKTIYLPKITNTTTFTVLIRESILNIDVNNTKIGDKTNITITLKDKTGKPISNAPIQYLVDDKLANGTTDENGTLKITCEIEYTGHNYVIASYSGNYSYTSAINSTIFTVDKLNTTATITATNTTLGKETTITGKIVDENNKGIKVPVIIYIDEETINTETDETGSFTFIYPATLAGENHVAIFYEGNDTYLDSTNKTSFHVEKHNTTITVTAQNTKLGEKTTIRGKLVDENGNKVPNAPVILIIEDEEINLTTNNNGEFTYNYTTSYENENFVEVFYEGNDTHKDSFNHAKFNVTKKAEAQIDIDILNDTVGNVEIEVTVTDEKAKALPDQTVEVTLPNGTKTNMTTDKDGKIRIKDTTTPEGNTNITVKVPDSADVTGTNKTKQFPIEPDYKKILEDMKDKIQELEDTMDKLNKTSIITAIPEESTVDDAKVTVTLNNKMGTPITNAPITVKNSKGEIIGNASTDNKGIAVIPVDTKAGTENITVAYPGNTKYTPAETTVTMKTVKNNVTVTVDPVEGIIGEKITLTAHVTDIKGNPVNGGNLVFKLNGKTLRTDGRFDSNASAWKFQVKNGIVTIKINADLYLRNTKNLTASYSGSYKYNEAKSSTVTAQIKKRNAKLTVTTSPKTQKQYNTIKFIAKLADTTPNTKNTTAMSTGTKVIFKVNGKTIKDNKGKNIQVKVVNNTATYKYKVPAGMGGVSKDGKVRDYNVEAVLVSDNYYPDTRDTATFNVERSPVTINIAKVSLNSKNVLNVQATIKDYKAKNVIGTNQVNIKINGKTYVNPNTGKTQNFQVTGGKISLKNIQLKDDITVKKVMIVTGARQAYLGARNETTKIVKA